LIAPALTMQLIGERSKSNLCRSFDLEKGKNRLLAINFECAPDVRLFFRELAIVEDQL
jgi:hypothetical protein